MVREEEGHKGRGREEEKHKGVVMMAAVEH